MLRYEDLDSKQLSFTFRFLNFLTYIVHKAYLFPSTMASLGSIVPPEHYEQATTTRYANLTIVQGIEGINPPIAVLPSLKYVWPRQKPQVSQEKATISAEILDFLAKPYPQGTALITFGNERIPTA